MKKNITAFMLILLGLWFLKLWYQGELAFYILPRFNILAIILSVAVIGMGIIILLGKYNWNEILFHLSWKSLAILMIPLITGFFLPAQPLSSATVNQRGVNTDLSTLQMEVPKFQIDSTKRTFADWIKMIGVSPNSSQYKGEEVNIKGFVYHEDGLGKDEFYLSRFLIRCCAADASPVVLRIKSDKKEFWKDDQWLHIKGVIDTDDNSNQPVFIRLDQAEIITPPDPPYIY